MLRPWNKRIAASRGGPLGLGVAVALLLTAVYQAGAQTSQLTLLSAHSQGSKRVVHQGEWAANLVHALGIAGVLSEDHGSEEIFSLLCPDRAELVTDAGGRRVPARSAFRVSVEAPRRRSSTDALRFVVSVPATALYKLSVEGVGAQRWTIDQRPVGHLNATALGIAQAPAVVPLSKGPHELSAFLVSGAKAQRVELSAYRPLCIAPAEGWNADQPLTFGAKARTLVRALGFERRLPEDGDAIPIEGESFVTASAWGGRTNRSLGVPASGDAWATAVGSPAEFTYRVRLDKPGVFTLLARVHRSDPQIWSIDGRYQVTVQPTPGNGDFVWSHVMTVPLSAGDHALRALVTRNAGIDLLRLVRHRSTDADYVALLEEAGFREGASHAPVTRAAAYANLVHPTFAALSSDFLSHVAAGADPLFLVEDELDQLFSRPLSPVLPPEL